MRVAVRICARIFICTRMKTLSEKIGIGFNFDEGREKIKRRGETREAEFSLFFPPSSLFRPSGCNYEIKKKRTIDLFFVLKLVHIAFLFFSSPTSVSFF